MFDVCGAIQVDVFMEWIQLFMGNNRKILILSFLLLIANSLLAQDTVYIDPSAKENRIKNGTLQNPFNSWDDLNWSDTSYMNGKVFLQKMGTVTTTKSGFLLKNGSGITFSSYGSGEMPGITSAVDGYIFDFKNCSGIEFRNLTVKGDTNDTGVALPVSCIRFFGKGNGNANVVENCELSYAVWGMRLMYGDGITVKNCKIHSTEDDGVFVESVQNIEILYSKIFDVNRKWFHAGHTEKEAPGDCIQLSKKSGNFVIKENYLDRSGTGNKFCFIHTGEPAYGVVEGNVLVSPESIGHGGACLFFGKGDSVVVKNNHFSGNLQGIYNHGKIYLYYNVFENVSPAITNTGDTGFVFNNVFYNCTITVKGKSVVRNNIFYGSGVPAGGDHNCCWKTKGCTGTKSIVADPQFVNVAAGDFHLKSTSPCIDKGVDVGLIFDMEGNEVPEGKDVDIGAYEMK